MKLLNEARQADQRDKQAGQCRIIQSMHIFGMLDSY